MLGKAAGRGAAAEVVRFFANPLVLILLAASGVSFALGHFEDAAISIAMVVLSVSLNFYQSYRSQKAVERLRAQVAPTATILRSGRWEEMPSRLVVPGDVIRLSAGDLVPADARIIEAHDVHAQQAALTGESLPSEKEAGEPTEGDILDQTCVVLSGTSIVSGTATAVVVGTGAGTQFGDVVATLARRPPETEFERGSRRFGLLIMRTVVLLVLFVFLAAAATRRDPLESLLFGVALAVGLTPEFLPMIFTVTLSNGAVHMARHKVVVKSLAAIQNFGSIDILCSDKTGTLTRGRMTLERSLDPAGQASSAPLVFGYLNSAHETGVKSPLDVAILERGATEKACQAREVTSARKVDEIPFDFERRRLSVVVDYGGRRLLISKGAPEGLLPLCGLTPAQREQSEAVFQDLSAQGCRVLAVASRGVDAQTAYRAADERDLAFDGFLVFVDTPLEDTAKALKALARDGVKVKILTGDNELVARHVCSQVGLDVGQPVLGAQIDRLGDGALGKVAEDATLFARVSPGQKSRILHALKTRGHVVGFLGDGINDAPSLHAADVGISVSTAVDIARDAAEVILLKPGLKVLHSGIVEGRKAFGNVVKYVLMGTSSNFGNMFSMAAAFLFLPFLPMLPSQILLNNFLYDLAQVTIPSDNVDPGFVRKPRRWDVKLIRNFMVSIGPVSSLFDFLTFFVLLRVLHANEALFHTGWFVESLATQTLVIFVIRNAGTGTRVRPSALLATTTLLVVAVGVLLPLAPFARGLGFVPLPAAFLLFLVAVVAVYLARVAVIRRVLMRRLAV